MDDSTETVYLIDRFQSQYAKTNEIVPKMRQVPEIRTHHTGTAKNNVFEKI